MDVAADLEHLRSIDAISHAYRASKSTAQPLVGIPASIVCDLLNNRVFQGTGSATTTYPNKYFALLTTTIGSSTLATSTDYIFSGSQLLGTIEGGKYATTTRYMHSDNLGSTDAVTNASGTPVQALDYYPYGSTRIASSTSGTDEKHKYIGQFTDNSGLSYLNARYYDSSRGQFLSEDPTFLALGNPAQLQRSSQQDQDTFLGDPQQLNSYSYSRDNPIINKDPSGNAFGIDDAIGFVGGAFVGAAVEVGATYASTGNFPFWADLSGAAVTGGIIGWGAVNTPEPLGASNAISASIITGLIGGYYGNLTKQEIDIATGKQKGGLNYNDLEISGLTTAGTKGVLQALPLDASIPGYSSGQGNMYATGQSMLTKQGNGTISNISLGTGVKSAVGSQAVDLYRTVIGLLTQIVGQLSQSSTQSSKK